MNCRDCGQPVGQGTTTPEVFANSLVNLMAAVCTSMTPENPLEARNARLEATRLSAAFARYVDERVRAALADEGER